MLGEILVWLPLAVWVLLTILTVAGYRAHKRGKEDTAERYWAQFKRYFKQWWRREPHLIVGELSDPYMLRWWLIPRNPLCNVYLHKFLRDDDDRAPHDHPWPSWSLLLRGNLRERVHIGYALQHTRELTAGAMVYRTADHTHRLELHDGKPAWTIFITGPWQRDWGFWCPKRWVPWRQFILGRGDPNSSGEANVGKGCGD